MPTNERQRVYRTHAVILRRRDFSDADRILTVYTPSMGKRVLIAKGIRKTTSRKAGHLELFAHTSLLASHARTWDIITEVVTIESFRHLRENLEGIGQAAYVCELVDSFTEEEDENQLLWDLLLFALREIDTMGVQAEQHRADVLLRWFELRLLSFTGFQPELFRCIDCGQPLEPVTNFLVLAEGGVLCPKCRTARQAERREAEPVTPDVLKVLRYLQSRPWSDVQALVVRLAIMQTVQNILHRYLLAILERHLKSTEFLRRLRSS